MQEMRRLLQVSIKTFGVEALSGPVEEAETLLKPEVLARLDAHFKGAYCIVVHDAAADAAIDAYLTGETVADDSGKSVMVLFEPAPRRRRTTARSDDGLGRISLSRPMADFARGLLADSAIVFPGALVVARLTEPGNALYVPLGGLAEDKEAVHRLRKLLAIVAANADSASGTLNDDKIGRTLAADGLSYQRGNGRSAGETLLVALRALWDARRDLAAIIGAGIKLARGGGKE